MAEKLRIIFMGTPDFAVPSLRILHENDYNIVGVITAPDKYGGRGKKKLISSAVKKYATENNLNILQPKNLKSAKFLTKLEALNANLQIVVAFRMLPEKVWNMPEHGTYNLHGSLLPKYRGAAPIHWAVINGEEETGVTSFKLKHKIDTGDLLMQRKLAISHEDTTGDVHDKMMTMGAEVILETVQLIKQGSITLTAQKDAAVSHAPKLNRENCKIDFSKSTKEVYNFIRGLSPFPLSWTHLDFQEVKIIKAEIAEGVKHKYYPGTIISDKKSYLHYCTSDGAINVLRLKMAGKKEMDIKTFLNGYQLPI
jgi:methionyl-tRNA formyltransferase